MPTPIKHPPRLDFATFWQALTRILGTVPRSDFTHALFTEVWRLASKVGYDPLVFAGQWRHETGDGTSGDYLNDGNPAGIGHTDGGKVHYLSSADPLVIARAWIIHMGGYIEGPDGGWLHDTVYKALDPRWGDLQQSGMMSTVRNVEDLGDGTWATQPKDVYGAKIVSYMHALGWTGDSGGVTPVPSPASAGSLTPKDVYVLVDAGHRETGVGGLADSDPEEEKRTIFLAQDDVKALRAAGYTADLWQEIDHDSDPTMTVGSLDTVALGCAKVIAGRNDKLIVFWSDHYNGGHSPAHVIVPDNRGLTTAYSGGAPTADTAQRNIWDVNLAGKIAHQLAASTGMALWGGSYLDVPGLMSEAECGVGLQGYRLALFAATAESQDKAIRLVIEHGGYNDPPATQDNFTQSCAAAKVAALNAFVKEIG